MNNQAKSIPSRVVRWVEEWLLTQEIREKPGFTLLAGDGSLRQFYRVSLSAGSRILLVDPSWELSKDYPPHQAFLKGHGVSVPDFIAVSPEAGCLIMEDLGDELLQHRLLKEPGQRFEWVSRACRMLADLHGKTFPVPDTLPAASRRFDTRKYSEELFFTLDHLVYRLLGLPKLPENAVAQVFNYCQDLEKLSPVVFSHRDYHSRNILVHGSRLVMIDFQDARLGPIHYDLASLLFDPYVPISESERARLCETYRAQLRAYPLHDKVSFEKLPTDLAFVAFQRVVKAAGSYASFYTRYGKTTHLPYLLPSLTTALNLVRTYPSLFKSYNPFFDLNLWIERVKEHPVTSRHLS